MGVGLRVYTFSWFISNGNPKASNSRNSKNYTIKLSWGQLHISYKNVNISYNSLMDIILSVIDHLTHNIVKPFVRQLNGLYG